MGNDPLATQWPQQALALHQAGRLSGAESVYLKTLAQDVNFYPALHLMGVIRIQQGRVAEALSYIVQHGLQHANNLDQVTPSPCNSTNILISARCLIPKPVSLAEVVPDIAHLTPQLARG